MRFSSLQDIFKPPRVMGSRSARVEDVFNYLLGRILYLSPRLNPSIFGAKKCIGGSGWLKPQPAKEEMGKI